MPSPLRLVRVVEISSCILEFSLKCGADGNIIPARSLPNCSPKVSSYAVLVCKARRSADFDDRPFVSQNSHMSNGFPRVFIMLKPHVTLLDELAFSKLVLILTPASVLSALGNVNRQRRLFTS